MQYIVHAREISVKSQASDGLLILLIVHPVHEINLAGLLQRH